MTRTFAVPGGSQRPLLHGSPLKATPASITTGEPKPGSECSFSTHLTFASLSAHGVRKIVLSVFFSLLFKGQILLSFMVSLSFKFIEHAFAIFKGKYLERRKC